MKTSLAAWFIVAGLGPLAVADPLDSKQVSADARWLVHVDVDALKTGTVPRAIAALWSKMPSASRDLKTLSQVIGMDPTEDLRSVTIYGERFTETAGVVIVRAKVDRERLMTFLRLRPGYRTDTHAGRELITWTENPPGRDEHTVTGCFFEPTVVVFGREEAAVRKALDVLGGTSAGLGEGASLAFPHTPAGTMIQARAIGLDDEELPFQSPLLRKSQSFTVALGEHSGEAFVVATMATGSEAIADQMQKIVDGLLAMVELQFDADERATRLLEAIDVSANGSAVTVKFRGKADDVSKLIKQEWKKKIILK
ncbi:MAG: hypothetical protein ACYTG0_09760 [Planctomycetota bacterium]|jgi:hypothetical protein